CTRLPSPPAHCNTPRAGSRISPHFRGARGLPSRWIREPGCRRRLGRRSFPQNAPRARSLVLGRGAPAYDGRSRARFTGARADSLEGNRAEQFDPGARTPRNGAAEPEHSQEPSVERADGSERSVHFAAGELLSTDDVYVDGVRAARPEVPGGLHHVRVVRGGG